MLGKETPNKCVSSTVRVDNIFLSESFHWELDDVAMLDHHDRVAPLGDDNQPAGAPILLGQHGNLFRNFTNIRDSEIIYLKI